jgi:hypothetical protein
VTNLFGRGNEPFWRHASTNLVKFVILLHQCVGIEIVVEWGRETATRPSKALSCGKGHACRPATPIAALSARLITNRYSTSAKTTTRSPCGHDRRWNGVGPRTRTRLGHDFLWMRRA